MLLDLSRRSKEAGYNILTHILLLPFNAGVLYQRLEILIVRSIIVSIKNFFKQFFLINDSPHKIAAGAALGVFLGIAPGVGVTATIVLASIFKFNRLAAIAGAVATNTWTLFLALPMAAAVGGFLFGETGASLVEQFNSLQNAGLSFLLSKEMLFKIVMPLTVGFVIVSGIIALLFYFLTFSILKMHHKKNTVSAN